ncbi:uncharacterized MFS-type transporter C09D4.1-like [Cloeon dipterum]|uniref:uncharacterized MFS-type transporter C09D4.1-like n=1 Tax=Cloeon dipterum TaxID=197152 RepID=UPI00321FE4A0
MSEEEPSRVEVSEERQNGERNEFKLYKRRWTMLAAFILYTTSSSFQLYQYTIIADVMTQYYQVAPIAINWTSTIYMLAFVVAIFPATWFYNKMGLRPSLLLAMGGTCVGAWIKVLSLRRDLFWVTMLGQTIVALCSTYALNIQVPLAATWFGPKEVSTACSIGLFGPQIGSALGFFVPVALVSGVPENDDWSTVQFELSLVFYGVAIYSTVIFVLHLIFLESEPATPPGNAQASRSNDQESVKKYIKAQFSLMKNVNFVLVFLTYSINLAVFSAITVFLSQMIRPIYPDTENDAGYMGVLITLIGIVGSVLVGFILDRSRRYKEMNIIVYALSTVAMVAYTFLLRSGNIIFVYVGAGLFGITMVGYLPAAFELAAELTYPEPEASSAGMMTFGCQLLSVLYTLAYGWLFEAYGDLASNLFMSASLLLGTVLAFFVKSDLRRQRAENKYSK